jgi:cell division protein FtsB
MPSKRQRTEPRIKRGGLRQALAAVLLLAMGGVAVAGPSGIVTWSDSQRLIEQRQAEIDQLTADRDALKNKVGLLDPNHPDADYAGQLIKQRLNFVSKDEKVMRRP